MTKDSVCRGVVSLVTETAEGQRWCADYGVKWKMVRTPGGDLVKAFWLEDYHEQWVTSNCIMAMKIDTTICTRRALMDSICTFYSVHFKN